ncbi:MULTISPECIES: hypothetical protein [unclassified Psychrobacter]|uniref:hypothetical protein n=1 Tax=unclassified Psychrobacter TaxID=196806 RepID=UPI0025B5A198|nr:MULTISPECIES: hypothetical protein [unclassified Psychrobacter]MDN3454353.1 hypothetical protein [Psychrobacter sp. APC 3350]MDN3501945.1 hypothetical protein [Psychrobacter sp. 5A.1]
MSDEKEDASTGFDEKLAKIINQKSRKRNNDIYERFITRVHSSEEGDQDDSEIVESAKNTPAFEDLSAEEIQLFENKNNEQSSGLETPNSTTNTALDGSNQQASPTSRVSGTENTTNRNAPETSTHTDTSYSDSREKIESASVIETHHSPAAPSASSSIRQDATPPDVKELNPQSPLVTHKKPVIIGMVAGLVVVVVIVLTLVLTGVFSTATVDSTESKVDGNVDTPTADSNRQTSTENVVSTTAPPVSEQQEAVDPNKQGLPAENEAPTEDEEAITYDDFRQESQTTLYRETND